MSPLRVILVARRFWPLTGREATALGNLGVELAARGIEVTVLTPAWQEWWPDRVWRRGVDVLRLGSGAGKRRGPDQFSASLGRWLRKHRQRYDLVYVSRLKHDAYVALTVPDPSARVVLRAERAGRLGDCMWQLDNRGGRRIKLQCMKADALIGPTESIERELIAAGYPRERIHHVPNGVPRLPDRAPARQREAREALARANQALRVADGAPVALFIGRIEASRGLDRLVAAWPRVVAQRPGASLWIAGDGPYYESLREDVIRRNLVGSVSLAGVFDSVEELLTAADLFISPCGEEGASLALLEAMAAGLPAVACNVPTGRELIANAQNGLLVPPGDSDALSHAVVRLIRDPDMAARLGAAARQRASACYSLPQMVDRHLILFESLLHASPGEVPR